MAKILSLVSLSTAQSENPLPLSYDMFIYMERVRGRVRSKSHRFDFNLDKFAYEVKKCKRQIFLQENLLKGTVHYIAIGNSSAES